jgi:hypothetical protein
MCYTITPEFRQQVNAKIMDYDLFVRLVDQCAEGGVFSIRLSLRGESFVHPRIVDCIRYAKLRGIREVSTLTNGLRLDEAMFREIMIAGLDWLTISFDGLGKVYEEIRRPARYDRAVEKIANYARIKADAGRVKPVIKIQSVLPAIENDPQAFYDVFAPIADMVSANPLIDYMQDTATLPRIQNFTCPQPFQRLVIAADGLCLMCANDERSEVVVGDACRQTIREIWRGPELERIRAIHRRHEGVSTLAPCPRCYLPLATFGAELHLNGRTVRADKYVAGTERLAELDTPDRFKREGLEV